MKQLKIKGRVFLYEKVIDVEDPTNYTYTLYNEDGSYIASAILNFQGVREIAKAYIKGPEAQRVVEDCWCF